MTLIPGKAVTRTIGMVDIRILSPAKVRAFRKTVNDYFLANARCMPWRETRNPYRILVSEIMLQQTQVERVSVKYEAFVGMFPDFRALADTPLRDVLAAWQGLGYNRRARALRDIARAVTQEYGGILPDNPDILRTLPGIGHATAGAITAFSFNKPVVFIETNIRTVYIHHFFHDETGIPDRRIMPLVRQTIDTSNPRRWYYALMDYGVMLKKNHGNPGRKSIHYSRQSPFRGSDREIRGAVIRELTSSHTMMETGLIGRLSCSSGRAQAIIASLIREGLIADKDGSLFIV